jgi:hypothetical protein
MMVEGEGGFGAEVPETGTPAPYLEQLGLRQGVAEDTSIDPAEREVALQFAEHTAARMVILRELKRAESDFREARTKLHIAKNVDPVSYRRSIERYTRSLEETRDDAKKSRSKEVKDRLAREEAGLNQKIADDEGRIEEIEKSVPGMERQVEEFPGRIERLKEKFGATVKEEGVWRKSVPVSEIAVVGGAVLKVFYEASSRAKETGRRERDADFFNTVEIIGRNLGAFAEGLPEGSYARSSVEGLLNSLRRPRQYGENLLWLNLMERLHSGNLSRLEDSDKEVKRMDNMRLALVNLEAMTDRDFGDFKSFSPDTYIDTEDRPEYVPDGLRVVDDWCRIYSNPGQRKELEEAGSAGMLEETNLAFTSLLDRVGLEAVSIEIGRTRFDSKIQIGRGRTHEPGMADGIVSGIVKTGFWDKRKRDRKGGGFMLRQRPEVVVNRDTPE